MASGADLTSLQLPPTRCIILATAAKSILPSICKCSWNILVTICWFQLANRFDRRQSWWKTNSNSWFVRRIYGLGCHFLLYTSCDTVLLQCVSFLKIPQNGCKSSWWRQNDIVFTWYIWLFTRKMDCSKHLNKLTCICVCQIFGLRQPSVLVFIK